MPEVFHDSPQGFWRPPAIQPESETATLAASCPRCRSEFLAGSQFCHVCGASRVPRTGSNLEQIWKRVAESLQFLEVLEFHRVQRWFGLSTAALAAFLVGVGCILGAITVGLIYSAQTIADFQAIQLWRIEWLLAAVASFVAGILLKKNTPTDKK
jgi:hypothetical protein